jgi:hypothetical protein
MMPKEKLRHADVVTALLLIGLSSAVLIGASRMPLRGTYGGVVNVWYVSPAAMPFVIGAGLFLMAITLLRASAREGGHRGLIPYFALRLRGLSTNRQVHRMVGVVALLGIYVYVLLGRVNFFVASSLYLTVFIGLYAHRRGSRGMHWLRILGLGIGVPLAVGYCFREFLLVPLP